MHRIIRLIAIAVTATVISGCVTSYQYRAFGEVTTTAGDTQDAVLYWHKDEGRLWYGKQYEQLDTSLTMRICEGIPKTFVLGEDGHVELQSRAGDVQAARLTADGTLQPLETEQRLADGATCGVVQANDIPVGTDGLPVGARPTISILCRNDTRPDRYPDIAQYVFTAVLREPVDEERSAPDPCLEAAR